MAKIVQFQIVTTSAAGIQPELAVFALLDSGRIIWTEMGGDHWKSVVLPGTPPAIELDSPG